MTPRTAALLTPLAAALFLAGCAKDAELYPSLSIRDEERVSGIFQPVEPELYVPPPPSGHVLDRLTQLRAEAAQAHQRFLAAAERARAPVAAARGAEPGSEEWSVALVALADAESSRSETMLALADLDRINIAARIEASEIDAIEAALGEVTALVQAQDQTIKALDAALN